MSEEMMEVIPENEVAENQDLFNQDGKKGVELSLEEQELLLALHKKSKVSSTLWKILGYVNMAWGVFFLGLCLIPMIVLSALKQDTSVGTTFLIIGLVYLFGNLILGGLAASRGKLEAYFCSPAIKREPICIVSHHNNQLWPIVFLVFSIVFLSPCCIVAWIFDYKTRSFVKEPANTEMFLTIEQRTLESQKY